MHGTSHGDRQVAGLTHIVDTPGAKHITDSLIATLQAVNDSCYKLLPLLSTKGNNNILKVPNIYSKSW